MTTKRLEILKGSLSNKENQFANKLQVHFDTVKMANGQPLNDKRNGKATLNLWERQNSALKNLDQSIDKTKRAIEIEEGKIIHTEHIKSQLPKEIIELIENNTLTQWRKFPNTFFVNGVEKARIHWDLKTNVLSHKFVKEIKDKEQYSLFAKTFNNLKSALNPTK